MPFIRRHEMCLALENTELDIGMTLINRFWGAAVLVASLGTGVVGHTPSAQAAFVMTIQEVGSDVDVFGSGSINLTALTGVGSSGSAGAIIPVFATIVSGSGAADVYEGLSGPTSFGSGTGADPASSTSGQAVGIGDAALDFFVPSGYVSGTSISSAMAFSGQTLASLGATPGTYVWTWGEGVDADSFTLDIIPEPVSVLLFGLPVAATMLVRRRAKRSVAPSTNGKGVT
jgi:hypothetical protein